MRLPKKGPSSQLKNQIYKLLYQVIADLKTPQEVKTFLESFLSADELEVFTRRLGVVYFLNKGKSYNNIKEILAISSTTIASIAQQRKKQKGYTLALKKIEAEEWADKWSKRLTSMMKFGGK